MEAFLQHFITQSTSYALIAVALFAFLESLALVGLIMPGTVVMAGLGALIGGGEINFYYAWAAGVVGCLLGDWISWWLGWRFKGPLHRWNFLKRYQTLLTKTEYALHEHSMVTILIGRFVGPTRPVVPMVAGMLGLSLRKFLPPNVLGCILWPPVYFMPGILAGAAINIPDDAQSRLFKWALLAGALLIWLALWLGWRTWRGRKTPPSGRMGRWLPPSRLLWLTPLVTLTAVICLVMLARHPLMPVYLAVIWQAIRPG